MSANNSTLVKKKPENQFQFQKFNHLFGMEGFSDKLLSDHFKLYEGYVTNTNTSLEKITALSKEGEAKKMELSEIRRRLGWEMNGMKLHEYYFGNLGGKNSIEEYDKIAKLLEAHFGDVEKWQKDFHSAGAMRGIGWVILYQDAVSGRLFNMWIEEHNANHLVGGTPLLVMDVFEHAYMTDYGTDKAKYLESFFRNIDWSAVEKRIIRK